MSKEQLVIRVIQEATSDRWWELVPAALGAVLGAAGAAIPAFILARRSAKDTLARDTAARTAEERATAFRGMVKLVQILNGAATLHHQVEETIGSAEARGLKKAALWQKLLPMTGFSDAPTKFESGEIALVFATGDVGLGNEMMLLAERLAASEGSLKDYSSRRRDLGDQLGAQMDGSIGTTILTGEQMAKYTPRAVELESAAQQLREHLARNDEMAKGLLPRYRDAMRGYFKDDKMLAFDVVEPGKGVGGM
ncbi:hypothetical protein [Sphingomonas mali]|uniref:hypothetical protein n=1 Tax=Sphingomonas mali TaxID=40682 RepID=UPI0008362A21|nr:hypothetical protein [Sphingomonas mali]